MKKIFICSALILGLATFAYAHGNDWDDYHMMGGGPGYGMMGGGPGYGMGMGRGMMGGDYYGCQGGWYSQSPEDQKAFQEYMDKTRDLRKQMTDLRFEYMEAYRNPKTDRATLQKFEQQMDDLRAKMYEIRKQMRTPQ